VALQVGLVGLPNVGKSTLFNAVSQAGAEARTSRSARSTPTSASSPSPTRGSTARRARAARRRSSRPRSSSSTSPGLVAGASQGEGLGNQFLAHIREVDAVCNVVRCFEDDDVVHVAGKVDPARDIEVITTELVLKDLETVEKRLERAQRSAKSGDKDLVRERDQLWRCATTSPRARSPAPSPASSTRPSPASCRC
jgi:ribosome-binding ATPase